MPRFKKLTQEQVVVMGKNTWLSLPRKPLPNRLNFVVTSKSLDLPDGAIAVKDLTTFKHYKNAWLIGGASLINSSWDYVDEIHLSRTYDHYDCDTFIDMIHLQSQYHLVEKTAYSDHDYEVWKKNGTIS